MKPLFSLVTGADFARSIAWAKATPNQVTEQVMAAIKVRLPSEVGLTRKEKPAKKRQARPDPSRRKWITKIEARKLGYQIP